MKNNAWMVLVFCGAAYAQTFEVASIRPAASLQMQACDGMMVKLGSSGGPGTKDPTRATYKYTIRQSEETIALASCGSNSSVMKELPCASSPAQALRQSRNKEERGHGSNR